MQQPALPPLKIALAQLEDLDTVISILEEAAAWLHARGIVEQWPLTFSREFEAEHVAAGEVYLARQGGQAIGTLMLLWSDPRVWGAAPDDAGYVHGLAIRRAAAGHGLGRRMLGWAETTILAAGRRYLRLDCWAKNHERCRYYERAGFASRGVIDTGGGWMCALFEKAL
jgi:ribosomal protein S18 acetylase RimI-like enzyme